MIAGRVIQTAAVVTARGFKTGAARFATEPTPKRIAKLKANQKKFQEDNGLPVYLKGGAKDKVLYNATVLGLLAGIAMSVEVLVRLVLR